MKSEMQDIRFKITSMDLPAIANQKKTIAIIGGGWYGCHTALELAKADYEVLLYDQNDELFAELSGSYGVRLHKGPHYPRSIATRQACREGYDEFVETYPELIVEHEYSTYALNAGVDALGQPAKISLKDFEDVFNREYPESENVNLADHGYTGVHCVKQLEEHSIAGGPKLREYFTEKFSKLGVTPQLNTAVTNIEPLENGQVKVKMGDQEKIFDHVVNATSFKAFLPPKVDPLPFNMETSYQSTVILLYEDLEPTNAKPHSDIVMDGCNPCLMPYVGRMGTIENAVPKYMLYHGSHTIRKTCRTPEEAQDYCNKLTDDDIIGTEEERLENPDQTLRTQFEKEAERFWPGFTKRFKYIGWKAASLAKIRSDSEFRSTVTFARNGIIYVFPGKINDIFKVAREVAAHIENKNILRSGNYSYAQGGVLDIAQTEIMTRPSSKFINTCDINRQKLSENHAESAMILENANNMSNGQTIIDSDSEIAEILYEIGIQGIIDEGIKMIIPSCLAHVNDNSNADHDSLFPSGYKTDKISEYYSSLSLWGQSTPEKTNTPNDSVNTIADDNQNFLMRPKIKRKQAENADNICKRQKFEDSLFFGFFSENNSSKETIDAASLLETNLSTSYFIVK
ncbi:MAG: FAD-binding oxidoreductase [Legionellales bacterium]|nr:FAD-binding oxidoreductase [Legionellales bacterium]